uniref:Collagen triple helix repeat protein n=1 Tax=Timema genevievae TaxID=629358 RepID=A0A7R9JPL1_TIMGE|nr:unnamed protein product [Timema genevievae]
MTGRSRFESWSGVQRVVFKTSSTQMRACKGCVGTYKCDCRGIKGGPGEPGIFGMRGSEGYPGDIGPEGPAGPKGEKGEGGEFGGHGEKGYRAQHPKGKTHPPVTEDKYFYHARNRTPCPYHSRHSINKAKILDYVKDDLVTSISVR